MQSRHLGALAIGAALVATSSPAFAQMKTSNPSSGSSASAPAVGAAQSRPGNEWSAGGLVFAPRYLQNVGDMEVGAGVAFTLVNSINATQSLPVTPVVGFEYKMMEAGDLFALFGPITKVGGRMPIMASENGGLGWAAYYRADGYFTKAHDPGVLEDSQKKNLGLQAPFFGAMKGTGVAVAQGAELEFAAQQNIGPLSLFFAPRANFMTNGPKVGAGVGFDLDFDRIVLGANMQTQYTIMPAAEANVQNTFVNQYSLGGRFLATENIYILANYIMSPADEYGTGYSAVLGGVGFRMGGGGGMRRSN